MPIPLDSQQQILDSACIGVWHWLPALDQLSCNLALQELLGASAQEFREAAPTWVARLHPNDREVVLACHRALRAGDPPRDWPEFRVRRHSGGWTRLRGRVEVTERDTTGAAAGITGLFLDVSREHELERRLHAVFDRPFQFIGLLTPAGLLLETNRPSVRASGHTLEEVLGKLFWEGPFFSHSPALQEQMRAGIERAARGELVRFEISHPNRAGETQTVDFTLTPLLDDDGEIVNIIPEGRDITEFARIREALRATEQRLILATEGGNVGLWDAQPHSGVVWFSSQWWSMLGYQTPSGPATLDSYYALLHEEDRERLHALFAPRRAPTLPEFDMELRMRCQDGSWRWIQSKGRVVQVDERGAALRVTGVHIDVTERKEAERRLAASERLESIGQLAAGVAHEINTPIQYINDSVYFIREGVTELLALAGKVAASPEAHLLADHSLIDLQQDLPPALERVVEGLARVAEIVGSMKEFAHPDRTTMAPVDLNRVIRTTLVVTRNEYKYVADLQTDLAELPPVVCQGGQINQVVLNLLVNAAHAIGDTVRGSSARGRITVATRLEGENAVISISDTGGGIPESIRHRIFDPFFTTKEVGRGTGQGLAIARNAIVHGHGGSLEFDTTPGEGTTFYVRLPVRGRVAREEPEAA